jgi:nicotinate-nucleotide pyrophosphorylase (carboxylating)
VEIYSRDFSEYEKMIKERALQAFQDDLGGGDITTEALLPGQNPEAAAVITAEEDCVLAGILEARAILEDGGLDVSGKEDGELVSKGENVLTIKGPLREMLARERVSLNYMSRMSGIATLSRRLSDLHGKKILSSPNGRRVSSPQARILFLRKTDPGLLFSEKRAVALGGCLPHRLNLSDGILIKDNHIDALAQGTNRLEAIGLAISRAVESINFLPNAAKSKIVRQPFIEIEVETVEEAQYAAEEMLGLAGPNIIMLDNMKPSEVKRAAQIIRSTNAGIIIEASGGISEENIKDYLEAGADYVSTSLFMSAKPCGFKLDIIQ